MERCEVSVGLKFEEEPEKDQSVLGYQSEQRGSKNPVE